MSKKALVSILIPLYNSEKYIAKTIDSCLNQTYNNIEIIIVDDGSLDNSFQIAKKFERPNVIVAKQENKGACVARNKAFELSRGEYIQYLDADDILSVDKIKNQIKYFAKYGNEIIISSQWDRFYKTPKEAMFPQRINYQNYDKGIDWIIDSIEKHNMGTNSMWLTPRALIEKAGKWNENLKVNQDGEFFVRVLLNAKKVIFCENAYMYYRSGILTSISQGRKKRANSLLLSYELIEENILKKENTERTRHACYLNYLSFIYENYSNEPELVKEAKQKIKQLGYSKLGLFGGKNFKKIAKIIGFENTLKLRKLLKTNLFKKVESLI